MSSESRPEYARNGAAPTSPGRQQASRAVAHSIVNRIGIFLLNVSTGILTARALGPVGKGQLSAMTLWPLFLANATALGTPSSLIFHLKKYLQGSREMPRSALVAGGLAMVTLLGLVAAGLGALVLPYWLHEYPVEIVRWAQLFLLAAPIWAIQITGQAALEALELFSASNLVQMLIPATTLTGLLGFSVLNRLTPVTAAICYTLAILPTAATILWLLWRQRAGSLLPGSAGVVFAACRTLLGYGVRSAPLDLLGTLSIYLDSVLVIGLLTEAAMGSYSVVLSLSRALLLFQAAVVMVLFPRAAGKPHGEIVTMVGHAVRINTLVTGAAALATFFIGPLLLRAMYGAVYLPAVPALRVLVVEVVLQGGVVVMSQAFMAAGRPGIVSLLQGVGLSLAVPLMFLLIPRYGMKGAALALLLSTCSRFLLIFFSFPIFLKTGLPIVIPGPADVRTLWTLVRKRI